MAAEFSGGSWPNLTDLVHSDANDEVPTKFGIVINGVLTWIDSMQGGPAADVWMAEAEKKFNDQEISTAKSALWNACGKHLEDESVENIKRKDPDKKKKEIKDINEALNKLKNASKKPLILATSLMVQRCPMFRGLTEEVDISEEVGHLSELKTTMSAMMKDNTEKIEELSKVIDIYNNKRLKKVPQIGQGLVLEKAAAYEKNLNMSVTPNKRGRTMIEEEDSEITVPESV